MTIRIIPLKFCSIILCLIICNIHLIAQSNEILHFDGTNDYVALPNNAALRPDASFTIEAWFVIEGNITAGSRCIISHHHNDGTTRSGYAIEYDGTNIMGVIGAGDGWETIEAPVSKDIWYHVAFVYQENGIPNNNLFLYIDGNLVNSKSISTEKLGNTNDLWIGGSVTYGNYWKGVTDEVRIWNTALTESEINTNKDIQLNGTEIGLVAYYNFNQGTPGGDNTAETSLFDKGPGAFHGALTNFNLQGCSSNWLNATITTVSTTDISVSDPNTTVIATGECLSGSCSSTYDHNEIRYGHICSLQDDVSLLTPGISKTEYSDSLQTQFSSGFTELDRSQKWYIRAYAITLDNDTLYSEIDSVLTFGYNPFEPILISQPAELDSIRSFLADSTLYFRLVNDIDLNDYLAPGGTGYAKWGESGWLPIGTDTEQFKATIFGGGHSISGLVINRPASDYMGLFGYTSGAEIDRLHIIDANVTGNSFVGPLSGRSDEGSISYSSATGTVTATTSNCGGLMGRNSGTVSGCYANTTVTSGGDAGGLIGYTRGVVKNSYAHGDVSATGQYCGGFTGRNQGDIQMCYSAGSVSGEVSDIGGFAGNNTQTISNSFWDTETSGMTVSSGGAGKTTSEMKTLSTFTDAGWDFVDETTNGTESLWNIFLVEKSGIISYPYLEKNREEPEPGKETIYVVFVPGGGILHFDGTDDYIELPNNAALRPDESFTIEAWFLFDGNITAGSDCIISKQNWIMNVGTPHSGYAIEYDGTNIKGLIGAGEGWETIEAPVSKDIWYHVAFVYQENVAANNNLFLYIDGNLVNSKSISTEKVSNTIDLWIGGSATYYTRHWKGVIDEVRIWNTARTESEINTNKDIQLNGTETGLVAYYNFNQGTPGGDNTAETSLFDKGPGAFHGALTNFNLQGCSSNWLNATITTVSTTDISVSDPNTTVIATGECLSGSCNNAYHYNEVRYGHICSLQDDLSLLTPEILKTEYSDPLQTQFTSGFTELDRSQKWYIRAYAINVGKDTLYSDINSVLSFGHYPFEPILISQPAELDSIRNFLADSSLYFRLVNDIDLSDYLAPGGAGYAKWGESGWLPIGTDTEQFKATILGGGHSISGLVINRPSSDYMGLFGYTSGAEIDSLHIIDANVTGNSFVGTLSGRSDEGSISYCSATGTVTATTSNCGGLMGWNSGTVSGCYANATVSSAGYAGGLIGYTRGVVENSYAHGDVSATGQYCGGFTGRNQGDIQMCYSAGSVSGEVSDIGGFAGNNTQTISNSFWDTETSGMTVSSGGTGKTTSEMKTLSTFTDAGWDFVDETTNGTENLWNIFLVDITGIASYPFLEKNREVPEPGKDITNAFFTPGGGILHFDGTNDYVALPNNAALRPDASFTIEAWFVIEGNITAGSRCIISHHHNDGTTRSGYAIEYDGTNIMGVIGAGDGWETIEAPVSKDIWYHVAFVYQENGIPNNNLFLYIDGNLVNSKSISTEKLGNTNDLWIGGSGTYGNYWKGITDEVRIWNTARTESEINTNKDIQLNGTEIGLVAYYNFNQGTPGGDNTAETNLFDNGPGAFHGALTNFNLQGCSSNWLNATITTVSTTDISVSDPNTTVIATGECLSGSCSSTYDHNEIRYGHICSLQDDVSLLTPGISKTEYSDSLQTQFTSGFTELDRSQKWYIRAYAITLDNDTLYSDIDSVLIAGIHPFDPITISQPAELDSIRNFLADSSLYFRLVNDIDLSDYLAPGGAGYAKWGESGWLPIGTDTEQFKATIFGGGHSISGLVINRPASDYMGLFGYTSGAEIDSMHIIDANVTGNSYIGILSGRSDEGSISYCSATGTVTATTISCGGLMGWNSGTVSGCYANATVSSAGYAGGLIGYTIGVVKNSYAHGDVSATGQYCGGFIGRNQGDIQMCYSAGSVSGAVSDIGGFAGNNTQTISNSFWDTETSGMVVSDGGTGKTTAEMKTRSTFTSAGWDFVDETTNGNENLWNIFLVEKSGIISYPYLEKNKEVPEPGKDTIYAFAPGSGDGSSPAQAFLIENKTQLNNVRNLLGSHFRQIADIFFTTEDFEVGGEFYNNGRGWISIGLQNDKTTLPFTGSYNGDGYNIDSLYTPDTTDLYPNCFIATPKNATIENVNLRDVDFNGHACMGFASFVTNTQFNNCHVSGKMSGEYVSSIFYKSTASAELDVNIITNCTAEVDINLINDQLTGAFIRDNLDNDSIINCSYTGTITQNLTGSAPSISGFIHYNKGYIKNCSASGFIVSTTGTYATGFVSTNNAYISDSYSDMTIDISGANGSACGFAFYNRSKIENCHSIGEINASEVGGFAFYNSGNIDNCHSTGDINASEGGGFVMNNMSNIDNCHSTGDINASEGGGFVMNNRNNGNIKNCYTTSNVYGNDSLGGFVVSNTDQGKIDMCYSHGTVTRKAGSTSQNIASFAVQSLQDASIINCYTIGLVQYEDGGTPTNKGFLGTTDNPDNNWQNYFDQQTTGQDTGIAATGLSTAEMKTEESYPYWNFYDVGKWQIDSLHNNGYPFFRDTARIIELSGSGTESDPYIIDHYTKLLRLSRDTSLYHSHFIQTKDVEFPKEEMKSDENGKIPVIIGYTWGSDFWAPFTGSYDGRNYSIKNFNVSLAGNYRYYNFGLFGEIYGAELKNIHLYADITLVDFSPRYISILCGAVYDSYMDNCHTYGKISFENRIPKLGGLCGAIYHSSIINSGNQALVEATASDNTCLGGFAGEITNSNILKCYNEGNIIANDINTDLIGLFVGWTWNSIIDQCYSTGNMEMRAYKISSDEGIACFAGSIYDASIIKNCYGIGNVVDSNAGKEIYILRHMDADAKVDSCYFAYSKNNMYVSNAGWTVKEKDGEISNCIVDTSIIDLSLNSGFTGKSTADMKNQSTFTDAGWDFVCETTNGTKEIWAMNGSDNSGYPYLAWQGYIYETEAPVITSIHNNLQLEAVANCEAALPDYTTSVTATDNCDLSLDKTQIPLPGTLVSGTTNPVLLIVTDDNGQADTVEFNVAVVDNTAPVPDMAVLDNVTGECSATITTAPTATDNCSATVIGTTTDPLTYSEQGTYTVTWSYDDGNGNNATQTQNVVIDDVTAPETPTLTNVTDECSATATAPTTTDNCAGTVTGTTSDPLTYTEQGTYTITWTFDDGNGNSIDVDQTVVIDDVTNPVTPTLAAMTDECSVTAVAPTTTDNCAGTVTGTTSDPTEYTEQGTHTITWTFDDGNGNTVDVDQTVVIDDVTNPVTPTLAAMTDECSVTAVAPTTTDNCAGTVTGTTTDPLIYTAQGTYTITWTFDDGNGNTVDVDQTVVIDDVTNPVTPTLAAMTDECSVTAVAPTTTDNCAGTVTGTTTDPLIYTAQGTYTITWTFDDGNGNSIDVEQSVIVIDVTNPEITCVGNQIINVGQTNFYTVPGTEFDPTDVFDNCEVASILNDFNNAATLENAQLPIGATTITWAITDIAGNENTCSFDVTVNTIVGISDITLKDISIYPNPTNGIVYISSYIDKEVFKNVEITDIHGKTISYFQINKSANIQIDISNKPDGIYFLKIHTNNRFFYSKIIKQ